MNISTERCSIHYTQPKQSWCNGFVTNITRNLTLFFLNLLIVSSSVYGQLPVNSNTGKLTTFNLTDVLYNDQQAGAEHTGIHNGAQHEWKTIQSGTLANNSNVQFTLDAMNPIRSLFVNTMFAPPEAADIDQLRNGAIGGVPTPDNWVNGNAGPQNSHFIESWSIPYRMRITGLANNSSHNIIIEWDIMGSSGTKHAIDYITHFQNLGSNALHSALFGHNAEVVNPGFGITVASTNTFTIPTPSSAGSPVPGQPANSFNALNLKDFTIYNGTITSMSYVSQGDLNTDGTKTSLSINFTANFSGGANTVVLGWGGHIASQADWGIGESASDINGSPYHTRLIELDGSGGNQDRSLKADAVVIPPECNITSPDLCPLTTSSTASASLTNSAGVATTYSWSLIGANTAGATLTGSTSGSVAAGIIAIPSVGISAPAGGFATGTSFTVQLSVSRTFTGVVFTSTCTKTVNITNSVTATATATPTTIDIRTSGHNTILTVSVSSGSINDYNLSWSTPNGQGQLSSTTAVSPVYTAVPADQGQTIIFNVTLTPKPGTSGLCPNNASVEVPVNATSTCSVTCLTNCSPCAGTTSTFRGPTLTVPPNVPDPNTFYSWAITSGDATINGPTNGETVSVTAGQTNYRLEVTITYTNSTLNQAPCGINVTVGKVTASDAHTNVSCFGGNDGSVTVTFSGGTAPYEVNFNGGGYAAQTSPKQYTGLTAGTYTWVVRDALGCEASGSETVTQPTELIASDGHTNVSCFGGNDGSVTVTFSGGTAPYQVNFNGGGFVAQTSPKQYTGLTAGTYTWVVKDANGCEKSGSETVTQPDALSCSLTTPSIPVCGTIGSTVSGTVSGGTGPYTCSASFDAAGVNAGWSVTSCAVVGGAITVTYTSGGVANTVLTVTVTDANNCTSTCTVTLTCDGGKGCTPGFWKTHPELWDNCNDLVVQAIPGASCTGTGTSGNFTAGADFTTSTPFVAYFGINNNGCGGGCRISNLPTTMGEAMSAGGGDCKKLARTGVAALLNAAVFGSDYLDATGYTSYAELYNAIKNGFNTCTYEPLATNLDRANNQDHSLCSGLPGTILTSSIVSSRVNIDNNVTLSISKQLTVQAYPNPFGSEINFRFSSPESGYANLEVFDMVGRKLSIVYSGHVDANVQRTVTYRVPATQHVPMIYKLSVGSKTAVGKVIPGDRNPNPDPKP